MMKTKQQAGRVGGQAVTPRKSEAARENGHLGGRPCKAAITYSEARTRVLALVTDLNTMLMEHAARQEKDPTNYGYAGDMNHYAELLEELLGRRK